MIIRNSDPKVDRHRGIYAGNHVTPDGALEFFIACFQAAGAGFYEGETGWRHRIEYPPLVVRETLLDD